MPVRDHILRVPGAVQSVANDAQLSRKQVAAQIGVTPNTLWRWEKAGKSPVRPRKRVRDGGVVYSINDVAQLRAWSASAGEALGQDAQRLDAKHEHATGNAGDAQ